MRKTWSIMLNTVAAIVIGFVVVITLINIGVIRQGGEDTTIGQ